MKKLLNSLLIFSALFINTQAGTIDPNVSDSKYLSYGEQFHNVVMIHGVEGDGTMFFASGVIIDDHHVLTAAHIVANARECTIILDKNNFKMTKIICHKNFVAEKFGESDIAICYCDKSFKLDFYPQLYIKDDEVKKVCSISGFGMTGTFKDGITVADNRRRAGSNIIDKVEGDLLICSPSLQFQKTSLEFLIGSGDSGGGLFIDGKLAGINSCVMCNKGRKPNSDYFCESGHTRISKYIDWIRDNTK